MKKTKTLKVTHMEYPKMTMCQRWLITRVDEKKKVIYIKTAFKEQILKTRVFTSSLEAFKLFLKTEELVGRCVVIPIEFLHNDSINPNYVLNERGKCFVDPSFIIQEVPSRRVLPVAQGLKRQRIMLAGKINRLS